MIDQTSIIRILAIAYIGALSFVLAFISSLILDKINPPFNKNEPKWKIFLEVCLQFGLIAVLIFASKNIIKHIPFPLDGYSGYIHSNLIELRTLPLLVFIFMIYQVKTVQKMKYLINI